MILTDFTYAHRVTALHLAAGRVNIDKILLQAGADPTLGFGTQAPFVFYAGEGVEVRISHHGKRENADSLPAHAKHLCFCYTLCQPKPTR